MDVQEPNNGAKRALYQTALDEAREYARHFLALNPSRAPAMFLRVSYAGRGRYRAQACYRSDQGTTTVATCYSPAR